MRLKRQSTDQSRVTALGSGVPSLGCELQSGVALKPSPQCSTARLGDQQQLCRVCIDRVVTGWQSLRARREGSPCCYLPNDLQLTAGRATLHSHKATRALRARALRRAFLVSRGKARKSLPMEEAEPVFTHSSSSFRELTSLEQTNTGPHFCQTFGNGYGVILTIPFWTLKPSW